MYDLDRVASDVDAIAARAKEIKKGSLAAALKFWYEERQAYEALNEQIKRWNAVLEELKTRTLPEMFDEQDVKTINLEIGSGRAVRFTKNQRMSCSMPDKEGGMKWLREEGHGDIIQETVNSSTLSAFAKSYIEDSGKDLPPELFKVTTQFLISATKA